MRARWPALAALIAAGCTPLLDLEGYGYVEAGPGSGGHGQGGSNAGGAGGGAGAGAFGGGGGGGSGGQTAPDWTSAMTAVYRFETPGNIGQDASGHSHDLAANNAPIHDTNEYVEGAASLGIADASWLQAIDNTDFEVPDGSGVTYGGWMTLDTDTPPDVVTSVAKFEGAAYMGYGAEIWYGKPNCYVGTGSIWRNVTVQMDWPSDVWLHFACSYEHTTGTMSSILNGQVDAQASGAPAVEAASFRISDSSSYFMGNLDEVFFMNQPLSAASVRRMWACGIDGARCACGADPTTYEQCGRAEPSCLGLPPCNQAAPE